MRAVLVAAGEVHFAWTIPKQAAVGDGEPPPPPPSCSLELAGPVWPADEAAAAPAQKKSPKGKKGKGGKQQAGKQQAAEAASEFREVIPGAFSA